MRCRRARQAPAAAPCASSLLRDGIDERGLARLHAIQLVRRFLPAAGAQRGLVRSLGPCRGDCARSVARFATSLKRLWPARQTRPPVRRVAPRLALDRHAAANKKARPLRRTGFFAAYGLAVTYLRFTVLFGMGRRGSGLLWPPDRRLKK